MQKKYYFIDLFLAEPLNIKLACQNDNWSLYIILLYTINNLAFHTWYKFFNRFIYCFNNIALRLFLYRYCFLLCGLTVNSSLFLNFFRAENICEWTLSLALISRFFTSILIFLVLFILSKFKSLDLISELCSILLDTNKIEKFSYILSIFHYGYSVIICAISLFAIALVNIVIEY